jgi:hypothetical protein
MIEATASIGLSRARVTRLFPPGRPDPASQPVFRLRAGTRVTPFPVGSPRE